MLKLRPCIFVALVLGGLALENRCPSTENIMPCTCQNSRFGAKVTCTHLQNTEDLRKVLEGLKRIKIYDLMVDKSNLGDVPGDLFKDTHIEHLSFYSTKLNSVGDDENSPFAGLENCLKWLTIYEGFWDNDNTLTKPIKLSHLKKLVYLNLGENTIPKLGNEWFENGPVSLMELHISGAVVQEVGDKAFASLKNLRRLSFTENSVTLKRAALPERPVSLDTLILQDNGIHELPDDLFNNLPSLRYIDLDNNALQSLPESTWKSVLPQLQSLDFRSNPLVCDSKIKWIFKGKLNHKIDGECASPKNLKGKDLKSLTEDDISG